MRKHIFLLLAAPFLSTGCEDPPDGLIDAIRFAMMGNARGCGTLQCPSQGVGSWSVGATAEEVATATAAVAVNWCPTWNGRVATEIQDGTSSSIRLLTNRSLVVSGFGSISITSTDLRAQVESASSGFKARLEHPSHDPGAGECPTHWVDETCRYIPEVKISTTGEIGASWVSKGERITGSISVGEEFEWNPETEQSWCSYAFHSGVAGGFTNEGQPNPTITDASQMDCEPEEEEVVVEDSFVQQCSAEAECAGLTCGEWYCDTRVGECVQAQAAPDGTDCPDGTCDAGVCTFE